MMIIDWNYKINFSVIKQDMRPEQNFYSILTVCRIYSYSTKRAILTLVDSTPQKARRSHEIISNIWEVNLIFITIFYFIEHSIGWFARSNIVRTLYDLLHLHIMENPRMFTSTGTSFADERQQKRMPV